MPPRFRILPTATQNSCSKHQEFKKSGFEMAKKQKLNLIEELTTHKCDYLTWPAIPAKLASKNFRSNEEPIAKRPPPWTQIDPQSHAPYNPSVHVPFDLYFAPKPIVGTDPRECFREKKSLKNASDREVVHFSTLPSPTIPLNEIEDEEDLRVILHHTYTQMHKVLMEEAALSVSKANTTSNRVITEGTDLRYKPCLYPDLPPGWVTAARHWDALQNRGLGDPFKTFWTRRGPEVECGCCCNPVPKMLPKETVDHIVNLINEDKLAMAYDITKTGYAGYRTICAKGVSLEKKGSSEEKDTC